MDYRTPSVRRIEETVERASCTPCHARYDDSSGIYVSVQYSQAAGQGFCAPRGVCNSAASASAGVAVCSASVAVTTPAIAHIGVAYLG